MLKQLLSKIESYLRTELTGVKIGRYKGEFEENSDWNPVFPIVLQRLHSYRPTQKNMLGQVIAADTSITLYIANKDINDSVGLDTLESVISNLDGEVLIVTLVAAVDDGEVHTPAVTRSCLLYTSPSPRDS